MNRFQIYIVAVISNTKHNRYDVEFKRREKFFSDIIFTVTVLKG
jgi:hypothetical protein